MSKKIVVMALVLALAAQSLLGVARPRIVGNWAISGFLQPEAYQKVTGTLVGGSTAFIIGAFEGDLAESPSRALSRLFLTDPAFTDFGTAFQIIAQMPSMLKGIENIVLHLQGYNKEKIILDFPVGSLLWRGDLALLLSSSPLVRYLWNSFVVSYGGVILTNELLIIPTVLGVFTGLELSLKGNTFGGAGIELVNLFGNSTDLAFIGGGGPPIPTTSLFQWTSTELILSGLSFFDWLSFVSTTKVSKENGFDFTRLDAAIEPEELELIKFDLVLSLSLGSTLIVLTTKFDLDIAFLYVYSNPVMVHGFIIPFIDLGDNELLSTSLALTGSLYKRKGISEIDLRARDYLIDIVAEFDPALYEKTPYDIVFSLEGRSSGLSFAGDLHFKLTSLRPTLYTGKISYEPDLTREFSFSGGLVIAPTGLQTMTLRVEWWFYGF